MQLELNRRSKVPMYRQLAAELREQIVSGAMAEGYRLPPERELSSRLEVNRTTVLQAYQQLKDEGLIASKVGKGTFVLPAASASRTSHTSNSDFGNAITRTTRSSAEMGTSQASSSGDVAALRRSIRFVKAVRFRARNQPSCVRHGRCCSLIIPTGLPTMTSPRPSGRSAATPLLISPPVRRTRRISRTICCAR